MAIFSISFLFLSLLALSPKPTSSFSFPRFLKNPSFDSQIALFGDAALADADSSIEITQPSTSSSGLIIYTKPISFSAPYPRKNPSFSTNFSFSITPGSSGIAFVVFPAESHFKFDRPHRSDSVLSVKLNASSIAVEFSCPSNRKCNGVVIDLSALSLDLDSGVKLHFSIDYNSGLKRLDLKFTNSTLLRPFYPLFSYQINVWGMRKGDMLVGLSSSSANSTEKSSVYSWSFELKHSASSMHSEPLDPRAFLENSRHEEVHQWSNSICRILIALVFGAGCGVVTAVVALFASSVFAERRSLAAKEYPLHPADFEYEKIVTVAIKDADVGKKQGI